jgi:putative Ca2+/H+ antiporter (TMEM165/GDT1 family)
MRPYLVVLASVFLAELGDKTQLATLLFATDAALSRSGVLLAAAGALVLATAIAVAAGSVLTAWLNPRHVRTLAAVGFIVIGAWMLARG